MRKTCVLLLSLLGALQSSKATLFEQGNYKDVEVFAGEFFNDDKDRAEFVKHCMEYPGFYHRSVVKMNQLQDNSAISLKTVWIFSSLVSELTRMKMPKVYTTAMFRHLMDLMNADLLTARLPAAGVNDSPICMLVEGGIMGANIGKLMRETKIPVSFVCGAQAKQPVMLGHLILDSIILRSEEKATIFSQYCDIAEEKAVGLISLLSASFNFSSENPAEIGKNEDLLEIANHCPSLINLYYIPEFSTYSLVDHLFRIKNVFDMYSLPFIGLLDLTAPRRNVKYSPNALWDLFNMGNERRVSKILNLNIWGDVVDSTGKNLFNLAMEQQSEQLANAAIAMGARPERPGVHLSNREHGALLGALKLKRVDFFVFCLAHRMIDTIDRRQHAESKDTTPMAVRRNLNNLWKKNQELLKQTVSDAKDTKDAREQLTRQIVNFLFDNRDHFPMKYLHDEDIMIAFEFLVEKKEYELAKVLLEFNIGYPSAHYRAPAAQHIIAKYDAVPLLIYTLKKNIAAFDFKDENLITPVEIMVEAKSEKSLCLLYRLFNVNEDVASEALAEMHKENPDYLSVEDCVKVAEKIRRAAESSKSITPYLDPNSAFGKEFIRLTKLGKAKELKDIMLPIDLLANSEGKEVWRDVSRLIYRKARLEEEERLREISHLNVLTAKLEEEKKLREIELQEDQKAKLDEEENLRSINRLIVLQEQLKEAMELGNNKLSNNPTGKLEEEKVLKEISRLKYQKAQLEKKKELRDNRIPIVLQAKLEIEKKLREIKLQIDQKSLYIPN